MPYRTTTRRVAPAHFLTAQGTPVTLAYDEEEGSPADAPLAYWYAVRPPLAALPALRGETADGAVIPSDAEADGLAFDVRLLPTFAAAVTAGAARGQREDDRRVHRAAIRAALDAGVDLWPLAVAATQLPADGQAALVAAGAARIAATCRGDFTGYTTTRDVTAEVLALDLAALHALRDHDHSTDAFADTAFREAARAAFTREWGRGGKDCEFGFEVAVTEQIADYFGVAALDDITAAMLDTARQQEAARAARGAAWRQHGLREGARAHYTPHQPLGHPTGPCTVAAPYRTAPEGTVLVAVRAGWGTADTLPDGPIFYVLPDELIGADEAAAVALAAAHAVTVAA